MITNCDHCNTIILQQVLEAGIPALCPACGPLYSVAKTVSASSKASAETQFVADLVCAGLVVWAGLSLIDQIAKAIKS